MLPCQGGVVTYARLADTVLIEQGARLVQIRAAGLLLLLVLDQLLEVVVDDERVMTCNTEAIVQIEIDTAGDQVAQVLVKRRNRVDLAGGQTVDNRCNRTGRSPDSTGSGYTAWEANRSGRQSCNASIQPRQTDPAPSAA